MLGQREGRSHRLGRVAHQRIHRVDVQIEVVRHVCRDATAGEPAYIFQRVLKPGEIVQVLQGRGTIERGIEIERLHCGPARSEMH